MDDSGAFVNLLNAEMEGLLSASKRNFARMLFGDGSGKLATTVLYSGNENLAKFKVDDASKIEAGMVIDIETSGVITNAMKNKVVKSVDHTDNVVTLTANLPAAQGKDSIVYVQGSRSNELTGLESLFGTSSTLYGLTRADYDFLTPYKDATGGAMSAALIQDAIDHVEERSGGIVNFIVTSYAVRKKYVAYCASSNHNVDVMNLDCGYKALSYSGIPFVVDRFCGKKDMYLLNTDDFKLHQLCDWRWIEDAAGGILKQESGSAAYSATLVKYADLMCERPVGQAKITNITVD
ncbi:MAG: phage major capsid protein [Clostridiales bacterium]|nr:MAG: phage major capsid protein [Clostridiales bacterium]